MKRCSGYLEARKAVADYASGENVTVEPEVRSQNFLI